MLAPMIQTKPMTDAELPTTCFAAHAWQGVSKKYSFVNTGDVVHAMAEIGLKPYLCKVSRTRLEEKRGYTKHMLRFRQEGALPLAGGVFPEVVIVNSHDTGSSFRAELGLYRLICKNGMVAQFANWGEYRGIHTGLSIENVLAGVQTIVKQFPILDAAVRSMQNQHMNESQRENFAQAAALLRWDTEKMPFAPNMLLATRREEDVEPTVWNVFNTVQENLLQGQYARSYSQGYRTVRRHTRAVGSIDVDLQLNRGLWSLAAAYA